MLHLDIYNCGESTVHWNCFFRLKESVSPHLNMSTILSSQTPANRPHAPLKPGGSWSWISSPQQITTNQSRADYIADHCPFLSSPPSKGSLQRGRSMYSIGQCPHSAQMTDLNNFDVLIYFLFPSIGKQIISLCISDAFSQLHFLICFLY